ncbi:MAG TPA: response regulator [Opitutaceae bacterium]|nr:response regulator [Opitutaceae bacterium]
MPKKQERPRGDGAFQASLGAAVRTFRQGLGITQEELAWRARMHRTYVADIERGARNLTLRSVAGLAAALQVSLAHLLGSASAEHPAGREDGALGEILLVEDDPRDAELTLRAFKRARLTNPVRVARDGAEALEILLPPEGAAANLPPPELVLLDLNLPKVGGLEVLRRMREDPRTRAIPVIILTVSRQDADIAACRRLGAETYIVKPVEFVNLCRVTPNLSLDWALLPARAGGRRKARAA